MMTAMTPASTSATRPNWDKVLSDIVGSVTHKPHQARALTEQETLGGMSLFCCALPGG